MKNLASGVDVSMPSRASAKPRASPGDDADELRKGLRGILAGGALGAFEETGVDPFDAPNEYDAAQRSGAAPSPPPMA